MVPTEELEAEAGADAVERERGGAGMRAYSIALVVMCAVAIVPLVAIAPFDRPSADDFSYSLLTHQAVLDTGGNPLAVLQAAVQTSANFYQTWQGLYTSAFCLALQPGIYGAGLYQVGAYLMIACIVLSCLYFAYAVERHLFRQRTRYWLPVGCVLFTVMLQCMPAINEAVYWFNGAANYTPWVMACLVVSGWSIAALRTTSRRKRRSALLLACVLSFVVSGSNYMPAFLNIMLLAGFACLGLRNRRYGHIAPLAVAIAGFALSAMAPGTAIRQSMFPDHPGVVSALAHSVWESVMCANMYTGISLIVAFALAAPYLLRWTGSRKVRFTGKGFAVVAALACLGMVGLLCVPIYSTGGLGAQRIYNTCFEAFVGAFFVVGTYALGMLSARISAGSGEGVAAPKVKAGLIAAAAACGIACIALLGLPGIDHGNGFVAGRELAGGQAAAYAQEYDAREAAIVDSGGTTPVGALTVRPRTLFFSDIVGADDWSGALAEYYGLPSVRLSDAPGEESAVGPGVG